MAEVVIGALSAALLIALAGLVVQRVVMRRAVQLALSQETRALDRAAASELRSAQQIDAMLERISTAPRIEMRPGTAGPAPDPAAKNYITDEPYMDEAWNDYRGAPDEESTE